jgi:DNA polymerase V
MQKEFHMASATIYKIPFARSPLSAGAGAFAGSDFEELDANLVLSAGNPTDCLAFTVTGDSCVPTIPNGSIVVVNRTLQPTNGSVIAASLNGLNHIKVFEQKGAGLRLVSPNDHYEPREIKEHDDFHVLGVVTGCCLPIGKAEQSPVYTLTDFIPAGKLFKCTFDPGLEIMIGRDSMVKGFQMASKILKHNILNWRG